MTKVKTIFTLIFFICIILRCVIHFFSSTFTPTILNNVITQQIDLFKLYYQYFRLHFISCVIIIGKLSNYFFIYSNHSILLFSDCQAKETQRRNKWCITFVQKIQHWSIPSKYCKLKNILTFTGNVHDHLCMYILSKLVIRCWQFWIALYYWRQRLILLSIMFFVSLFQGTLRNLKFSMCWIQSNTLHFVLAWWFDANQNERGRWYGRCWWARCKCY